MTCTACGNANPERAKFCLECGAAIAARCASCGTELPPAAKFCLECGASSGSAAPARAGSQSVERSPRTYTPKHLADKILQSKSALEGERKQVTVLFADVKGSMELAEQLDAEEWHRVLERFFAILTEGVHRFEGTVNQYTGDGIMALFGAPIAHEDHAQRACYAALWLRDALRAFANELRRERGLDFATRIGMNSGEVVVGKIGDDLRMDYTAQGQTVGLAQRMEALAEAGAAYLSGATAKLVTGYFDLEDLGAFNVKGSAEPQPVYSLRGVGALRTRLDLSRSRGLSRFVGRQDEVAVLEGALARADAGKGQVVGIVAEAGTGKSRLCFEFTERCRSRGEPVLEACAPPHGKNVPMLPVMQLLRSAFGIEERDSAESARDKVAGRIVLRDESLKRALPLLFDLLGVPDPARPGGEIEPEIREREILNVMRALLRARSERSVGVILVEDLHWLDPGSERFLAGLVDAIAGTRTLVVVNFRPEYGVAWSSRSYYQQVPLQPLGAQELGEMLTELLGNDRSLSGLDERILAQTGGNPFFIEEVIRALAENGSLEGARGSYRLVGRVDALDIPPSVHGILAARIDKLPEREKQVLQHASVIGPTVRRSLLGEIIEVSESELDDALRGLVASELLFESALYPEPELSFKHALTRDVAYASLLRERRASIHAALADALERVESERLDENASLLAHHREQAGQKLEAARAHRRAGVWFGMRAVNESLQHFIRAAALVGEVPETAETRELGVEAVAYVIASSFPVPEDEAASLFKVASGWAERSDDPTLVARIRGSYGANHWVHGNYDAGAALLRESARTLLDLDRRDLVAGIVPRLTMAAASSGALDEAIGIFDRMRATLEGTEEIGRAAVGVRTLGLGYMFRACWLAETGRVVEGEESLARGFAIVQQHSDPSELCLAEMNVARFEEFRGNARAALAHWGRAEEIGVIATMGATVALTLLERWRDAVRTHEQTPASVSSSVRVNGDIACARARFELGEVQRAKKTLVELIERAPARGARLEEIRAQLELARLLARTEGSSARSAIETCLQRAADLIEETGARLHLGGLEETRAELRRALGDEDGHRAALAEARRLYTEMGATGHAERIARNLEA